MNKDYLKELNDAQRAAVEYVDGPELVIAGAGSGKTRVLTYKIMHLLKGGMMPNRILALTFTNKAAKEMRERIGHIAGEEAASRLWMGTFHSIFARILRRHAERIGFKPNFTIYDATDSKSLIKTIIRDMDLDDNYRPGLVQADISNAKNNLYSPEDYAADAELMKLAAQVKRPRTADIFAVYRDRCRISCAMDFDDLLYYTNVLMRDNPDILESYSNNFQYVLVDEYQDTNYAQHLIVRQLCRHSGKLCVVGDDAQSIYSFRGANIRNILDLNKSFPSLKIFKLEANYRSTGMIVDAANSLIACNIEQFRKDVYATGKTGDRIEVVKCYNEYEESYVVANRLSQVRMRNGDNYSDIAILYRTNAQSRVLEEALRSRNIPYRIYGGLAFYQRKEVKDAVSYFRLSINPADDEAIRRIINTPRRGIGDTTVSKISECATTAGVSMWEVLNNPAYYGLQVNKGTLTKLNGFTTMLATFVELNEKGTPAKELARTIYHRTSILAEYVNAGNSPENVSKRDNLYELLNAVDANDESWREEHGDSPYTMGEFLSEVSLLSEADIQAVSDDCVTLMTIHSAKGLEFQSVFIVGVEEDLLPSARSSHGPNAESEVEEERRLMYVALTRAKRFCMITYAGKRTINGKTTTSRRSRFIDEIDRRYLRTMTGTSLDESDGYAARPSMGVRSSDLHATARPTRPSTPTVIKTDVDASFCLHNSSELQPGMRIAHSKIGHGEILSVDTTSPDHRISVAFDDGKTRTLLLKFAHFKILP